MGKIIRYDKVKKKCSVPMFIHIELTERCPLNCRQCYCSLDRGKDLPWEICYRYITEAAELGVRRILLTGGEPLLYHRLSDAIKLISSYEMESVFSTSGVGISLEKCMELKNSGIDKVYVSLNGSCEQIHNLSRDCFKEAVKAIKMLKNEGIWCGINWVARHDNVQDFENLCTLAKELKVDRIDILSNKSDRYGKVVSEISWEDLNKLSNKIREDFVKGYVTVELCYPELIHLLPDTSFPTMCEECTAGKLFMEVNVDGSFSKCRHQRNKNFNYTTMKAFWEHCVYDISNCCLLRKDENNAI